MPPPIHSKGERVLDGTLILSGDDVASIALRAGIDSLMDRLIARTESAFADYATGRCEVPARSGFHYGSSEIGLMEWMPVIEHGGRTVMKMVGYHPTNPVQRSLPTILATIAILNQETGHLEAIVDGTIATAMRTGAASAVATRWMANPDSRTVGLIGCGAQAVTQLHAMLRVLDVAEVLIFDTDLEAACSFASRVACLGIDLSTIRVSDLATVVAEADVLCVATSVEIGRGPVFPAQLPTKPWLHINAIGSDFPGKIEIPRELLRTSFVCPDFRAQAEKEGECQQLAPHEIGPDIVQLGQRPELHAGLGGQRTVFDSTGFAIEDYAAVSLLYDLACEFGLGTLVEIEYIPRNPRSPYEFAANAVPATKTPCTARSQVTAASRV